MGKMSFSRLADLLRVSGRQVMRQRLRYIGVLVSIALGTGGVIVILTMGRIIKQNLDNDLTMIGGATIIQLFFDHKLSRQDTIDRLQWFHDGAVRDIRALPGVLGLSETVTRIGPARTTVENRVIPFPLMGVDEYYWLVTGQRVRLGRGFEPEEVSGRSPVCVLGETSARKMFGAEDPVGKHLRIDNSMYTVVGVMSAELSASMAEIVFLPITTVKDRVMELPDSNRLILRCRGLDDVQVVAAALPGIIGKHQGIDKLRLDVPEAQLKQVQRIVLWVESFIYFSVVGTLLLGGYGIWNGMMTAVRQRIREIGLKKAMGAQDIDILAQFLAEALCLTGGAAVVGVGLGLGAVSLASNLMGKAPSQEEVLGYTALSFFFSLGMGAVAGFFPALRASRMEVVSAIRYE